MVLKGGRIFDGTGNPSYVADIGITESRITRIGFLEEDAPEIADVRGFAVSPGFIDLHNHSDHTILPFPDAENYIMQGVTTSLGGNCGISMAPLSTDFCKLTREYLSPFLHHGYEYGWDWKNTGDFSRKVQENGTTQNVGFLVGHGTLRIAVKGFDRGACSPEEMRKMRTLLDEAMEEGAFGLSAGLIYSPGSYASEEELSELTARIGKKGGF
jgi:N-acyl-D-amino-acid deacylase